MWDNVGASPEVPCYLHGFEHVQLQVADSSPECQKVCDALTGGWYSELDESGVENLWDGVLSTKVKSNRGSCICLCIHH